MQTTQVEAKDFGAIQKWTFVEKAACPKTGSHLTSEADHAILKSLSLSDADDEESNADKYACCRFEHDFYGK